MPTTRPRHAITETDPIARALDDAARHWPEDRDNRARLLVRLVEAGHRAIDDEAEDQAQRRRVAVERTSGALAGVFDAEYLRDLREDWPE